MPAGRPDAEVHIDEALIRRLLTDQHPDLATLQPTPLDSGWDNEIYRLGDAFTVRMPRRQIAANLLVNEQTWLPELAPRLPIAVPSPVRTGTATDYYPWRWSVLPWFEGESADLAPPATADAERFADFLLALHHEAPANAPYNPVRGVPLRVRENNTQERLIRVREKTDLITAALEEIWGKALAAPGNDRPRWLHGDLHAQNVLVDGNGTISAVIDWGDITAGDVATDLAGIWALFETPTARARCLAAYAPDSDLLARARGWAFSFGVILVDSGLINSPRHATAGTRILTRLAADAG
jgi:aminoglycoside phosphotransferase (APT) family kinase protein